MFSLFSAITESFSSVEMNDVRRLTGAMDVDAGTDWFSIPTFFVLFRETLEVMIIVSCMICALEKLNLATERKWITYGCLAGLAVDVVIGVALIIAFETAKNNAFDGSTDNGKIFEGTLMLFAAIVITVFALGLTKFMTGIDEKFKAKMEKFKNDIAVTQDHVHEDEEGGLVGVDQKDVASSDKVKDALGEDDDAHTVAETYTSSLPPDELRKLRITLWTMAFFAVFREGLECIVFLAGLTSEYSGKSMIFPAFAGVIIGLIFGYFFVLSSKVVAMFYFVLISMFMLFLMAAGLVSKSFSEWIELGANGGPHVFNARECCANSNGFWSFLRLIFGYNDNPTVLEFMTYFGYWIIIIAISWYRGLFKIISKGVVDYQINKSEDYMKVSQFSKVYEIEYKKSDSSHFDKNEF